MDNKPHSPNRWLLALGASAVAAVSLSTANAGAPVAAKNPAPVDAFDWKANTIAPVTNPIFFEDPVIRSEVRPIFVYHTIDKSFITAGGHATLYALQIRYALTDRLAFIATQDGHFDIDSPGLDVDGWMDLAAGFKYALIDDAANQFILTPGLTFHIPTGDREIFQGRGGGEFRPFVSFAKGFGDLLKYIRSGDTLFVYAVDRLGRDAIDVQTTVRNLLKQGIAVHIHGLGLIAEGVGELILAVLAQVASMEKARIIERTAAGRATAQELLAAGKLTQHGKASMGRPLEADPATVRQWKQANSASISVTAKHFDLSVSTVKRYCPAVSNGKPTANE